MVCPLPLQVELLALFSNPTSRHAATATGGADDGHHPGGGGGGLGLKPLQLGRELKFLLHSLPPVHLAIEPAASLADARAAIEEKDPRLILFSGHSFMGGLVFELDDGRLDCPPPAQFIAQLQPQHAPRLQVLRPLPLSPTRVHSSLLASLLSSPLLSSHPLIPPLISPLISRPSCTRAPRLQCVCLNGCETAELGYQIVSELPWLKVICWPTITEDAAARAFAQGFYDAVGAFVSHGGEVQRHGQSGRLGWPIAGHHGLVRLQLKAWGWPCDS